MQFWTWLRLRRPPLDRRAAHLLTMSGLEVESCEPLARLFRVVVTYRIAREHRTPTGWWCRRVGEGEPLRVCAAHPMRRRNMKVPCAKVAPAFPTRSRRNDAAWKPGCSARRRARLSRTTAGCLHCRGRESAACARGARLEDRIFTLKLTPNRADCLSLLALR